MNMKFLTRVRARLSFASSSATYIFSVSSSTTHTSAHNHSAQLAGAMRDVALKAILKKKVKGNEDRV